MWVALRYNSPCVMREKTVGTIHCGVGTSVKLVDPVAQPGAGYGARRDAPRRLRERGAPMTGGTLRAAILLTVLLLSPACAEAGGWYLVTPPDDDLAAHYPDARWTVFTTYEGASQCQRARIAIRDGATQAGLRFDPTVTDPILVVGMATLAAQCVASDDPRLARLAPTRGASPGGAWYLMAPPNQADEPLDRVSSVNRDWSQRAAFDSAQDCERGRLQWANQMKAAAVKAGGEGNQEKADSYVDAFVRALGSQCVAAADPRLSQPPKPPGWWYLVHGDGSRQGPFDTRPGCERYWEEKKNFKPIFDLGIRKVPDTAKCVEQPQIASTSKNAFPAPAVQAVPGTAIIVPLAAGKYIDARVNGRVQVRLLLDTGADSTVIASRVLGAAGASGPKGTAKMRGATGQEVVVDVYHVTSLEVGSARVDALRVLSYDIDLHPGTDGLLGRDFLGRFTVTVDTAAGRVTLSPKR